MAIKEILKNFNLFVDGIGYAGQIAEYTPPTLTVATEDYRAGGMDSSVPIDMGLEPLVLTFVLNAYGEGIIKALGESTDNNINFTIRGALEDYTGKVSSVIHSASGKITSISRGTWAAGELSTVEVNVGLVYYKETINDKIVIEVDILNFKRIINGKDRLAGIRKAIGV